MDYEKLVGGKANAAVIRDMLRGAFIDDSGEDPLERIFEHQRKVGVSDDETLRILMDSLETIQKSDKTVRPELSYWGRAIKNTVEEAKKSGQLEKLLLGLQAGLDRDVSDRLGKAPDVLKRALSGRLSLVSGYSRLLADDVAEHVINGLVDGTLDLRGFDSEYLKKYSTPWGEDKGKGVEPEPKRTPRDQFQFDKKNVTPYKVV